jgi:hypothetical protein
MANTCEQSCDRYNRRQDYNRLRLQGGRGRLLQTKYTLPALWRC